MNERLPMHNVYACEYGWKSVMLKYNLLFAELKREIQRRKDMAMMNLDMLFRAVNPDEYYKMKKSREALASGGEGK